MGDRWLILEVEPSPVPERRPVAVGFPLPPPRRHRGWSITIGVVLISGAIAVLVGAWLGATSGRGWNAVVGDSAVIRDDLAVRSRLAATALTDEFAELEVTAEALGDVTSALDAASLVAADLERVARAGPPTDSEQLDLLVGSIFRLADALDDAFPGLAEVGLTGPTGPGEALRAVSEALTSTSAVPPPEVTGFGPFVLQNPLPGHAVTDPFGTGRGDRVHNGVDLGAPSGTEILAAADGIVERAGWLDEAAGNGVILRHGSGWETRYFHMLSEDVPVRVGERVVAGQVIGEVGSTGLSTGPHLHFEIVYGPVRMDPLGSSFTYDRVITEVTEVEDPPATGGSVIEPTVRRPQSEILALSDVLVRIADVQSELKDIASDASDEAGWLQARTFDQQSRSETAGLILYAGAILVVLGLLLIWVTRPQWPLGR